MQLIPAWQRHASMMAMTTDTGEATAMLRIDAILDLTNEERNLIQRAKNEGLNSLSDDDFARFCEIAKELDTALDIGEDN